MPKYIESPKMAALTSKLFHTEVINIAEGLERRSFNNY